MRVLAAMLPPCQAQQRAQEAAAREATANAKVLAREVEIGALKGEIAVLKTQTATQVRAGRGGQRRREGRGRDGSTRMALALPVLANSRCGAP